MFNVFECGLIGMGPAGLGLAISLRDTKIIKSMVCFDKGSNVDGAECFALSGKECCGSSACSIISGIGGASTLSGGKISNYPAGSGLASFFDSENQLRELFEKEIAFLSDKIQLKEIQIGSKIRKKTMQFYKQKKIDYKYYDVYEFNGQCYRNFIKKTVQELKNEGMKLFDNSTVLSIKQDQKTLCFCINVKTLDGEKQFFVRKLVLATGALDIRDILLEKIIGAVPSGFEIGVRIEVPSSSFGNVLSTHGDLKLKYGAGRTYCVTANGRIISYYTDGMQFLEGCAESFLSDDYTNLAVLIKQSDKNAINDFFERYRSIYKGNPIKQKFVDYSRGRASDDEIHTTLASAICGDINNLFSLDINTQINRFIRDVLIDAMGLAEDEITLVAPELKIIRDFQISKNFEISRNLFAIGSMTGRFRGILQSYCSGIRCGQFFRKEVE